MCLRRRLIMRANRNLPRKRCRKYRIKNQTPSDCCSTRIKRRIIIIVVIHYLYRPVVARLSIRFRVKMLPDFVKIIQRGDRRGFLFINFFSTSVHARAHYVRFRSAQSKRFRSTGCTFPIHFVTYYCYRESRDNNITLHCHNNNINNQHIIISEPEITIKSYRHGDDDTHR